MKDRLRLTAEDLDTVRANLDWQAMFEGLRLQKAEKKSKADDWWAFSPFHEETNPSFHMSQGGRWYDFSIGEGGGCIELIQKLHGLNCFEAGAYIVEQGWSSAPQRQRRLASSKSKQTADRTSKAVKRSLPQNGNELSEGDAFDTAESSALSGLAENVPIRQDLLPLCTYHEAIEARGVSEATAQELGIGYLAQGRSPLRGRIVFQVRDARPAKKKDEGLEPVILSHLGRAIKEDQEPKYLFYEGFHKSQEILGQDRLWLDPRAAEQIKATGCLVLSEGPFDWAKAVEADLHNVGALMGASLSDAQARKIKALSDHYDICAVRLVFDRDAAGQDGAAKAKALLNQLNLDVDIFNWARVFGYTDDQPIKIPENIRDMADFSGEQLTWLRNKGWL